MSPMTRELHQMLIRAARMALAAWEKWLAAQAQQPPQQ